MLAKVCSDVQIEPGLQPVVTDEANGNNAADEARLDIRSRGFWRRGQNAFFDVRVTNASAVSQMTQPLKSLLVKHEKEKKRKYSQRVMDVEQGTFTPLVFTVNGSMGPECEQFHRCLASKLAEKTDQRYADVMNFIRCKLSFIIIRAAVLCLRGSRKVDTKERPTGDDFSLFAADMGLTH